MKTNEWNKAASIGHYQLQDEHLGVNWNDAEILEECMEHHVTVPICAYVNNEEAIVLFFAENKFSIVSMTIATGEQTECFTFLLVQFQKALLQLTTFVTERTEKNPQH